MPNVLIRALRALSLSALVLTPAGLAAQSLFSPAIVVNGDVVSRYELRQREEFLRRRKRKNFALGVTVAGLILLIYVVSIIRMSGA